ARAAWLDLRERRLAGMAAELSATLAPGEPCAVCGALDHPAPAHLREAGADADAGPTAPADATTADLDIPELHRSALIGGGDASSGEGAGAAPDSIPLAEQEQAAQDVHTERAEERGELERAAGANASALAAARAIAGEASAEELRADAARLAEQHNAARTEADGLAGAERELLALATAVAGHEQARREAEQAAATARAAHAERSAALTAERERVTAARGDAPSIAARVAALRAQADACEQAASAAEQAARTTAAHAEAASAAAAAAQAAGFGDDGPFADIGGDSDDSSPSDADTLAPPSPDDVLPPLSDADEPSAAERRATARAATAVRDAAQITELEQRLRDFDEGIARRSALVQDESLRQAAAEPAPDLPALRDAAARAAQQDEASQGRNTVEQRRLAEVTSLSGALDSALTALAPVAERERLVRELAALADGGSAANRLRMRLSAYVLAARLEEVAAAATARLEKMSNGRYALIHADDGARGRRRGGLDLKIVDGWTGQERSPSTLSGGETFLASLALALGLADVVAADAGGSRLETLFIDEGFGSLDERTLDEVLDVLDALREGGRAVGIV
ncbi:MAG TPA: SbcC/MukB-like Walker B domain-containing protein, partial [Conexibacter sp.]|nr:SbcC/MukB-like Walker B domain-containing protein [Conexibacter sp.]